MHLLEIGKITKLKLKKLNESNVNLFLDTTIQVDRFTAPPEKKEKLDEILIQAKSLCTSTYVKMEYRRSLIQDLVFLYNDALSDVNHLGEVMLRINRMPPQQQRRTNRMFASLVYFFFDEEKDILASLGKKHIEMLRLWLKQQITYALEDFGDGIESIINKTDCYNAKTTPLLKGEKFDNRTIHCKPSNRKCKIVEFFLENIDEFKKIYQKLSLSPNLDEEQERMKNTLEKALKHPINMADYKNCWKCADSIIALECPEDILLFTTNRKHFEPICEEIGRELTSFEY